MTYRITPYTNIYRIAVCVVNTRVPPMSGFPKSPPTWVVSASDTSRRKKSLKSPRPEFANTPDTVKAIVGVS